MDARWPSLPTAHAARAIRHTSGPWHSPLAPANPILPLGAAARSAWTLGSWDAFQIPKPGSRAVITVGEALFIPESEDLEPWRRRLEAALDAAEREADAEVAR